MKIAVIGAGRVGCSIGKYLKEKGFAVAGFYSRSVSSASWAAEFTESEVYTELSACVEAAQVLFVAVPDGAIADVWQELKPMHLTGKVICHFSGCMTSEVFDGIEQTGAFGCSVHPMFAFDDKETAYRQLDGVGFTAEGEEGAVSKIRSILESCGNEVLEICSRDKVKYHAAASVLSNHVAAVLDCGYQLLQAAGFSEEQARTFTRQLVLGNVAHVIEEGAVKALTGPIERGDAETVRRHLQVLTAEQEEMYRVNGRRLVEIAQRKHPERSYDEMKGLLEQDFSVL